MQKSIEFRLLYIIPDRFGSIEFNSNYAACLLSLITKYCSIEILYAVFGVHGALGPPSHFALSLYIALVHSRSMAETTLQRETAPNQLRSFSIKLLGHRRFGRS